MSKIINYNAEFDDEGYTVFTVPEYNGCPIVNKVEKNLMACDLDIDEYRYELEMEGDVFSGFKVKKLAEAV